MSGAEVDVAVGVAVGVSVGVAVSVVVDVAVDFCGCSCCRCFIVVALLSLFLLLYFAAGNVVD